MNQGFGPVSVASRGYVSHALSSAVGSESCPRPHPRRERVHQRIQFGEPDATGMTVRTSEQTTGPLPLLFNLELDPGESYDLTAKHPDVTSQLAEQMTRWEAELAANPKGWKQ